MSAPNDPPKPSTNPFSIVPSAPASASSTTRASSPSLPPRKMTASVSSDMSGEDTTYRSDKPYSAPTTEHALFPSREDCEVSMVAKLDEWRVTQDAYSQLRGSFLPTVGRSGSKKQSELHRFFDTLSSRRISLRRGDTFVSFKTADGSTYQVSVDLSQSLGTPNRDNWFRRVSWERVVDGELAVRQAESKFTSTPLGQDVFVVSAKDPPDCAVDSLDSQLKKDTSRVFDIIRDIAQIRNGHGGADRIGRFARAGRRWKGGDQDFRTGERGVKTRQGSEQGGWRWDSGGTDVEVVRLLTGS